MVTSFHIRLDQEATSNNGDPGSPEKTEKTEECKAAGGLSAPQDDSRTVGLEFSASFKYVFTGLCYLYCDFPCRISAHILSSHPQLVASEY